MITDNVNDFSMSSAASKPQSGEERTLLTPPGATQDAAEITHEQLALSKKLLNWRTLLPLVVVIVALIIFAQKSNINPQKTWNVIRSANLFFFLLAFVIYYCSFAIRALRWRLLLENVGFTRANGIQLPQFWKLCRDYLHLLLR